MTQRMIGKSPPTESSFGPHAVCQRKGLQPDVPVSTKGLDRSDEADLSAIIISGI